MDEKKGIMRDKSGKLSSKRMAGIIILIIGVAFHLTTGIMSYFRAISDPTTAVSIGNALIFTGAGLLGIGVIEQIGVK